MTSRLLKRFGKGANVVGSLDVDRALRRSTSSTAKASGFDITSGELVEGTTEQSPETLKHALNRVPKGAMVLSGASNLRFVGGTKNTFTLEGTTGPFVIYLI